MENGISVIRIKPDESGSYVTIKNSNFLAEAYEDRLEPEKKPYLIFNKDDSINKSCAAAKRRHVLFKKDGSISKNSKLYKSGELLLTKDGQIDKRCSLYKDSIDLSAVMDPFTNISERPEILFTKDGRVKKNCKAVVKCFVSFKNGSS